jgi:hypothetical protein
MESFSYGAEEGGEMGGGGDRENSQNLSSLSNCSTTSHQAQLQQYQLEVERQLQLQLQLQAQQQQQAEAANVFLLRRQVATASQGGQQSG